MSVDLNCPSCGASVGEASSENNYKEKFYYKNDKGEPICKNCGAGNYSNYERNLFIIGTVIMIIIIILSIFL